MADHERRIDLALWTVAVLLLVALVVLSVGPGPPTRGVLSADKLWHGVAYAALTASWLLAAVWRPGRGPGRWPGAGLLVAAGAAALGGAIELLQGSVGRSGDVLDLLADLAGVAAASTLWALGRRRSTGQG